MLRYTDSILLILIAILEFHHHSEPNYYSIYSTQEQFISMEEFDPHALLLKIRGSQPDPSPARSDYRRTQNLSFSHASQKVIYVFIRIRRF
jgi:hypothetical protein